MYLICTEVVVIQIAINYNLQDTDVVSYEIEELSTLIKRVNFVKTNAFQFEIGSDDMDKHPVYFVTPDIAIKYRITERVR